MSSPRAAWRAKPYPIRPNGGAGRGLLGGVKLRRKRESLYTPPVPADTAIVVSDAHLGYAPDEVTAAFHRFLEVVPALGNHLVINGDLFEFWFEYRSVIPRQAFPTLEALAVLRRAGVQLTLTGGNHDRWGGPFWTEQLGAAFHPDGVELVLGGLRALVTHGDELGGERRAARLLHRITRHRAVVGLFRTLHPDLAFGLVRRLSPHLAAGARDEVTRRRAAGRQLGRARDILDERGDLNLVVNGHTHLPSLVAVRDQQWYVNPGAWAEGFRYATVTAEGPLLRQFGE